MLQRAVGRAVLFSPRTHALTTRMYHSSSSTSAVSPASRTAAAHTPTASPSDSAAAAGSMAHATCCGAALDKHKDGLSALLQSNRRWAAEQLERDPDFFNRLVGQQNPEYLWIGCSDSRVPANQILGLAPGDVFVQRNVGNQAMHTDMNLMSCLEYAVKSLKVKTIIVTGHYNCGAVKAALQLPHATPGLVNCWISDIRECRNRAERELAGLDPEQQVARLCELNVLRQVFHVATSPVVASAWAEGAELHIYGCIYDVADGHLRKLAGPISGDDGYARNLEGFVSSGLRVTRCPDTQQLCVAPPDEATAAAAASAVLSTATTAGQQGSGGGSLHTARQGLHTAAGGGEARSGRSTGRSSDTGVGVGVEVVGDSGGADGVAPLMQSSPSEVMSSINSMNLVESIAKHKQWAVGGGSRSARVTADAAPAQGHQQE